MQIFFKVSEKPGEIQIRPVPDMRAEAVAEVGGNGRLSPRGAEAI